jgi:DNA-binding Lrp family transcriptional regulator
VESPFASDRDDHRRGSEAGDGVGLASGRVDGPPMDEVDRKILRLLTEDARRPLSDIAAMVGLSAAPVKRRIERLEASGVIEGYTAIVNYAKSGTVIEAFTEVRIAGTTDIEEVREGLINMPEILQIFTISGDPDALIHLRVSNVEHLKQVVHRMRKTEGILGTKTLIVLDSWTP